MPERVRSVTIFGSHQSIELSIVGIDVRLLRNIKISTIFHEHFRENIHHVL